MMEALVTLQHKGLKFEHTYIQCTLMPWQQQPSGNHAEISHMFEPKSRHIVNMVTYIIYISKKQ